MSEQLLSPVCAEGLGKRFRASDGSVVQALSDVSFSISPGRLTALVGADGAGKSTLLRLVCGLLEVDAGSLTVLGLDSSRDALQIQSRISYMPQRFGLYEDLTVRENMDLYADLHGIPASERPARYERLLAMTDLAAFTGRPAGKLSGGMKQKLGLACTLVRLPDLLVLDEPSVGVDPLSRRELWNIVRDLVRDERLTVIWASSYMDEAEKADEVIVLHEGRILTEGVPDELTRTASELVLGIRPLPGEKPRELQAFLHEMKDVVLDAVPEGGRVNAVARSGQAREIIEQRCGGRRTELRAPRFEDFFMARLRQSAGAGGSSVIIDYQDIVPARAQEDGGESEAVIEVKDLLRKFGNFVAVDRTSFSVRRGEIFGLLGPNGAGKTTTFRMLCGLLPATDGCIRVAGCDLRRARARARARIGYVAQKFSLYGNLTIAQNLRFFGGAYGLRGGELEQRIEQMTSLFDLPAGAAADRLTMGHKRRLAIAAALLHRPQILFLDEPTSGIDPVSRRDFWYLITRLARDGVTVIVTTHFMEEAEYCDRVAIQDAGRLLALGSPEQILRRSSGEARDMNEAFIAIVREGRESGGGHG